MVTSSEVRPYTIRRVLDSPASKIAAWRLDSSGNRPRERPGPEGARNRAVLVARRLIVPRAMRSHLNTLLLLPVLGVVACIGMGPATEDGSWGVGEDPGCDPAADHCWPEADRATLTGVRNELDEAVALPSAERSFRLRTVLGRVRDLGHKLGVDEAAALDEIELRLADGAGELSDETTAATVGEIRQRVTGRIEQGMVQAHLAPIDEDITAIAEGELACAETGVGCAGPTDTTPLAIPTRFPQGMQDALNQISSSSLFGKTIVGMLLMNGALDMNYEAENARLFGEYDEATGRIYDSGLSPAARVDRIVGRARALAGWAGAVAGAESLVPLAGIAISIGHEEYMLFEIHTKMAFRIAQVYGWDVKSGPALISVITLIMEDGLLLEGTDILLSNVAVPLIARRLGARFGYSTADQIVKNLTGNVSRRLLAMISAKARKKLTQEVVENGAKAVARQLFGWITFGATVAISAGADYYFTWALGHRVKNAAQRWLGDLMHQGSTYLGNDEARECAFQVWSRAATVDGQVADEERKLYQAYMANQYWMSETLHFGLSTREQTAHAATLRMTWENRADANYGVDADACLGTHFEAADEQHRMTLLAYVYAMVNIDGDVTVAERALYDSYRAALNGGMFRRLDADLINQIERTVVAEIRIPNGDVAREYGIRLDDVVPALTEIPQATTTAYAAAGAP